MTLRARARSVVLRHRRPRTAAVRWWPCGRIWEKGGFDEEYSDDTWEFGLGLLLDGGERLAGQAGGETGT
ncbi:hypothetical protein ACL02T_18665 [Pseudonocardia sp. RS010]|uniref:hypothetical protein n=1 Tax=Pseudonocardia sp. RS010 TaxID=3385979 RepID=UPI0039A3C9C3